MPSELPPFEISNLGGGRALAHDPQKWRSARAFRQGRPSITFGDGWADLGATYHVDDHEFEFRIDPHRYDKTAYVDIVLTYKRDPDYRDTRTRLTWPPLLLFGVEIETDIRESGKTYRYWKDRQAKLQAYVARENRNCIRSGLQPEYTSRLTLAVPKRHQLLRDLAVEFRADESFFAYDGLELWEVSGLHGDWNAQVSFEPIEYDPFADLLSDADKRNDVHGSRRIH